MSEPGRSSSRIWVVVGVVVAGAVLCCAGAGVVGYLKVRDVAQSEGGLEGAVRGMVADMAGERDEMARGFLDRMLAQDEVGAAYEDTSDPFRATTDRAAFDKLHALIVHVMGHYRSARIRTYNVRTMAGTGTAAGTFHDLVYDAEFEKGPGVVTMRLRSTPEGLRVESFRVDSPLFDRALLDSVPTEESPEPPPEAPPASEESGD